ncbi:hypothetical protein BDA96_07G019800 [Sorghum bicolor]|uniref:Uncharacterized protein n=1 Tax=Sorghum bicolor TaxID=4558 RepID=A0A921QKK9_SORBI|nr:hypothetical protein BDA96_07G019800 [Sorghum bicolor]
MELALDSDMAPDSITRARTPSCPDSEMVPKTLPQGAFICGRAAINLCSFIHRVQLIHRQSHEIRSDRAKDATGTPCSRSRGAPCRALLQRLAAGVVLRRPWQRRRRRQRRHGPLPPRRRSVARPGQAPHRGRRGPRRRHLPALGPRRGQGRRHALRRPAAVPARPHPRLFLPRERRRRHQGAQAAQPCFVPTAAAARLMTGLRCPSCTDAVTGGDRHRRELLEHARPVAARNGWLVLELQQERYTDGLTLLN